MGSGQGIERLSVVIARSEATKQSTISAEAFLDCFASLAMTVTSTVYLFRKLSGKPPRGQSMAISSPLPDSVM
jgi:hypothetical protein